MIDINVQEVKLYRQEHECLFPKRIRFTIFDWNLSNVNKTQQNIQQFFFTSMNALYLYNGW